MKITARQLEALKLVYFKDLTYEQAGCLMGITKQAVYSLLKRLADDEPAVKEIMENTGKKRFFIGEEMKNMLFRQIKAEKKNRKRGK